MITDTMLFNIVIFVTLYFLVDASLKDLKYNEVENGLWIRLLFIVLPFIVGNIIMDSSYIIKIIASFTTSSVLLFILYKIRVFGGADVKLLMCLSIIYPMNMFLIPIVTIISLIASIPVGLIKMKKEGRLDGNVTIAFIPIISIVFFACLYFSYNII